MTEPAGPEVLLDVRGLSAGYGDLRILKEVSLSVWAGKVTAVLGSNGAGKTTLLSTISGLVQARSGSIELLGREVAKMAAYKRSTRGLALVQEGKRIFRHLTVAQNLMVGGAKLHRDQRKAGIERAYERFPVLGEKRSALAGSLSGGQQQMLAIGQALVPSPRVLMLDEPSAGLAPIIVNDVLRVIKTLASEGVGIILVEQLVDQALSVADRVMVLDLGSIVIDRPVGEVTEHELASAYLGVSTSREESAR